MLLQFRFPVTGDLGIRKGLYIPLGNVKSTNCAGAQAGAWAPASQFFNGYTF